MNRHLHLCLILVPAVLAAQSQPPRPAIVWKPVTFTVVDPDGRPVEGASVAVSRPLRDVAKGLTGADGTVVLELAAAADIWIQVSKAGYYDTGGELWTGGLERGPDGRLAPVEAPDAFTILLKDIRNPVPLRRVVFRDYAPAAPEPVGFDLRAGDWVAPYGRGTVPDMLFHFQVSVRDASGFAGSLTISFPNPDDGIQPFTAARPYSREFGSNLAPPHEAPLDGYLPTIVLHQAHRAGEPFQSPAPTGRNYLFRSRSQRDPAGRLTQACYGWVQGEFEFDIRDPAAPQLAFIAFFNDDPDPLARSLEGK